MNNDERIVDINTEETTKIEKKDSKKGKNSFHLSVYDLVSIVMSAFIIIAVVFTFVFVLVVLGTTDEKKGAGNFAGLAIGLSLVLVHLACIYFTGTSVNPARSIAPAVLAGGAALNQLWIFIVGPFAGGALAALVWKFLACDCCCCKKD